MRFATAELFRPDEVATVNRLLPPNL